MRFEQQNYAIKIFKLLANANRIMIIDLIANSKSKKLTVNEIASELGLEVTNVSNHLVKLRENNVLKARQDGLNMFYSLKDSRAIEFVNLAKKLA